MVSRARYISLSITLLVVSVFAAPLWAEQAGEHPGTTPGEMRYKGSPVDIEAPAQVTSAGAPELSPKDFQRATQIYFERCAGCHGVLRKGATGKPLTPDVTGERGTDYL